MFQCKCLLFLWRLQHWTWKWKVKRNLEVLSFVLKKSNMKRRNFWCQNILKDVLYGKQQNGSDSKCAMNSVMAWHFNWSLTWCLIVLTFVFSTRQRQKLIVVFHVLLFNCSASAPFTLILRQCLQRLCVSPLISIYALNTYCYFSYSLLQVM